MNILLLSASYSPEKSGIAPYSEDLAIFLSNFGHKVHVITSAELLDNELKRESINSDLRISRIAARNSSSNSIITSIFREVVILKKLNRFLFESTIHKPDLIISVVPSLAFALIGCRYARKFDIPNLVIFQDMISLGAKQIKSTFGRFLSPVIEKFESYILKYSHSFVAISPEICTYLSTTKQLSGKPINLIYNYQLHNETDLSNFDFRKSYDISLDVTVVMHTGNMGRKQDLQNVIKAAEKLKEFKNIIFVIVGAGNQESSLRKMSEDLDNVLFLKFVDKIHYVKLIKSANFLLVNEIPTQLGMSLPSKLTSYMTSGIPILACVPLSGPTAKFLDNKAILIEPANPKKLAQTVLQLSKQSKSFEEMTERAKRFAESELSATLARNEYLRVVESCYMRHTSKKIEE